MADPPSKSSTHPPQDPRRVGSPTTNCRRGQRQSCRCRASSPRTSASLASTFCKLSLLLLVSLHMPPFSVARAESTRDFDVRSAGSDDSSCSSCSGGRPRRPSVSLSSLFEYGMRSGGEMRRLVENALSDSPLSPSSSASSSPPSTPSSSAAWGSGTAASTSSSSDSPTAHSGRQRPGGRGKGKRGKKGKRAAEAGALPGSSAAGMKMHQRSDGTGGGTTSGGARGVGAAGSVPASASSSAGQSPSKTQLMKQRNGGRGRGKGKGRGAAGGGVTQQQQPGAGLSPGSTGGTSGTGGGGGRGGGYPSTNTRPVWRGAVNGSSSGSSSVERVTLAAGLGSKARCLDGSPPAYYLQRGTGSGAAKWLVLLEGGGWCFTAKQCYIRSLRPLGSSRFWPDQFPSGITPEAVAAASAAHTVAAAARGRSRRSRAQSTVQQQQQQPVAVRASSTVTTDLLLKGILSPDEGTNPDFYNWNIVRVRYCDGGSFASSQGRVERKSGAPLYFAGRENLFAVIFDLLKRQNMVMATDIVLGGCSAGAVGVSMACDSVAGLFKPYPRITFKCLMDAGFFLDTPSVGGSHEFREKVKKLFRMHHMEDGIHPDCKAAYAPKNETWRCFFPQYSLPFVRTPMLIVNSVIDYAAVGYTLAPAKERASRPARKCLRATDKASGCTPAAFATLMNYAKYARWTMKEIVRQRTAAGVSMALFLSESIGHCMLSGSEWWTAKPYRTRRYDLGTVVRQWSAVVASGRASRIAAARSAATAALSGRVVGGSNRPAVDP